MIKARTLLQLGGGVLMVISFLLSWPVLQEKIGEHWPIEHVRVEGAFQYISKKDVQEKIIPLIQAGYFAVDLQAIQQAVMSLPWAETVQVQREWPNRIKLRIYEQKPVVRWQNDSLLNAQGAIFKPLNIDKFQSLPVLYAPLAQRQQLLAVMQGLRVTLKDQDLYLTEFRVSDRQSWLLQMSNGMSMQLGRLEPLLKFAQLMKALTVSGSELVSKMAYVDMRYPNGYAVRWRENEKIRW